MFTYKIGPHMVKFQWQHEPNKLRVYSQHKTSQLEEELVNIVLLEYEMCHSQILTPSLPDQWLIVNEQETRSNIGF